MGMRMEKLKTGDWNGKVGLKRKINIKKWNKIVLVFMGVIKWEKA